MGTNRSTLHKSPLIFGSCGMEHSLAKMPNFMSASGPVSVLEEGELKCVYHDCKVAFCVLQLILSQTF